MWFKYDMRYFLYVVNKNIFNGVLYNLFINLSYEISGKYYFKSVTSELNYSEIYSL